MIVLAGAIAIAPRSAAAATNPQIVIRAAASEVTLERWPGDTPDLDFGIHIVAGGRRFQVNITRKSYDAPVAATQIISNGARKQLPAGLVRDLSGLTDFMHLTIANSDGLIVHEEDQRLCPGKSARSSPDAPPTSPFPVNSCGGIPWQLGNVVGVEAGWSTNIRPYVGWPPQAPSVELPDGVYTVKVTVNEAYRSAFNIPADGATATVRVTVKTRDLKSQPAARLAGRQGDAQAIGATARRVPVEPTGRTEVPNRPKPDLRPLPAWNVELISDLQADPSGEARFLAFSANVWNAGSSPLVVDGFRRHGQGLMDAYQYFFDTAGNQTGYVPTGTFEWDDREGHRHWHFTDFAQYRLLGADNREVMRSQKEAFCIAPTHAVDLTTRYAEWQPGDTDLHTACGEQTSISLRQVLPVGHGDTYLQYLPGQSFDIKDLPNGTYYIEIMANPNGHLYESDTTNNVSYRKIIVGGVAGARTVLVPPVGLVDA